jgi:EAL domain-containing protein (putative c-di-GMP-specific phosphodiesterase class I)
MAAWQKTFPLGSPLTISVNVSARQLSDPRLMEDVHFALAKSGLDPTSLALEMTESSIMGDAKQTMEILDRLKAMNIRLQIDDFGTGYSSLSRLQRLPFDNLKIDRSFIRELTAGNGCLDIVRAIMQLAHSLKLDVVAEGVETEEQLRSLRQLGCDYMQGFLFSRPVDAQAATKLYQESCEGSPFSFGLAPPGAGQNARLGRLPESIHQEESGLNLGSSKRTIVLPQ